MGIPLYPLGRNDRGGSRALDVEPPKPWALVRLRRELPIASVITLISEMMRRRLTSFDVILKASTVYRFLRQQRLIGNQVASPVDCRRCEAELLKTFSRVTLYAWADAPGGRQTAQDLHLRLNRRHEPLGRQRRILSLLGPGHLSIGLALGFAQTGATTHDLPRQRPSLSFTPPGRDHHLPEHCPGPLTALRAPWQG
ncbi:hypothetical protein DFAR_4040036 [Desulfarculales bacterium]